MPYIKDERRKQIDYLIDEIVNNLDSNRGEYNYVISKILHNYVLKKEKVSYAVLNDAVGIIECVKQEFLNSVVNPYEDKKREENGDISSLSKK